VELRLMISYLLRNGRTGQITDPVALRTFYTRLSRIEIYGQKQSSAPRLWWRALKRWTTGKKG
jgi:hypothetical protein